MDRGDCRLRIADLTARNAKIAKKKHLFVLFVFFVVKELFMGLRIADWREQSGRLESGSRRVLNFHLLIH
jgi:hypothetical protein